jgi:hypothetical protein
MTDRQLAALLDRPLQSVRSYRQKMVGPRATSPKERWEGDSGVTLGDRLAREYRDGASQSTLIEKYHVEWTKLQAIIQSHGIHIRGKSQQAFIQKFGRDPEIISRLTGPKLHLIFAMFGDGLRPTSQTRRNTHIIGIAAGKDRDFAEYWISNFEQEYGVRPSLKVLGRSNIQASISSVDIWNDLHRYATFGTRSWKFNEAAMRHLMGDRALLAPIGYGVRGLFDADGSVKYEVKRASRQVTIASVNRVGLAQVSMLLTHIGQGHRLYEDCIAIFGRRNLVDFQSKIGFGIRRKNEALIRMVSSFRIKLEKGGL